MRRGQVDEQTAVADWLKRGAKACRELGSGWEQLEGFLVAGGGGMSRVRRAPSVGAGAVPLRVDVVDIRDAVASLSARYVSLARGTLRDTVGSRTRLADDTVRGRLRYLAGVLPRLHDADPDLVADLVRDVWAGHRRVHRLLGDDEQVTKPFRLDHVCPECGLASLWFDPHTWQIGCGMPDCAHVWAVDQPVLKHVTKQS